MAVFTTSDKLGQRPTVSAAQPVQSYNAGMPQKAAIDAAGQLRQSGKQIEQLGANITADQEQYAREQKAEQEKQVRLNDAILEAQMKSAMLRTGLEKDTDYDGRSDYDAFGGEDETVLNDVATPYLENFSPETKEFMRLEVENTIAERQAKISGVVRTKRIDRNNAIELDTTNQNLLSYGRAVDPATKNSLYQSTKQMVLANHLANKGSEEDYVKKMQKLDGDFALANLRSMPLEDRAALLDGKDVDNGSQESVINFVIDNLEGGDKTHTDNDGGITKFGINKNHNPTVDVKKLTKSEAIEIYKDKYWDKRLNDFQPDFRAVAFDSIVNHGNDNDTWSMINQANGDTQELIRLREEKYAGLVATGDPKYVNQEEGWNSRLKKLNDYVGGASQTRQSTGTILDKLPLDVLQNEVASAKRDLIARDKTILEETEKTANIDYSNAETMLDLAKTHEDVVNAQHYILKYQSDYSSNPELGTIKGNELISKMDAAYTRVDKEQQERIDGNIFLSGSAKVLPTDEKQNSAYNKAYRSVMPSMQEQLGDNPIALNTWKVKTVSGAGAVPADMKGEIISAARGNDFEAIQNATDLIARVKETDPYLASQLASDEEFRRMNLISDYVDRGFDPKDAMKAVDAELSKEPEYEVMRRQITDYEKTMKEVDGSSYRMKAASAMKTVWDSISFTSPEFMTSQRSNQALDRMEILWEKKFKAEYAKSRNFDVASKAADFMVQTRFQRTKVNGGDDIMEYPPETVYRVGRLSPEQNATWIRDKVTTSLKQHLTDTGADTKDYDFETLHFVYDPFVTNRGMQTVAMPHYKLMMIDKNGLPFLPLGVDSKGRDKMVSFEPELRQAVKEIETTGEIPKNNNSGNSKIEMRSSGFGLVR